MELPKPSGLPIVAISEWVMVLPATIFLAAAALRVLQPREYEPAHTSWIIVDWTAQHVSRGGAAVLFLALPSLAIILGCAMLLRTWRDDEVLRHDSKLALTIIREHMAAGLLTTATLLAGAILVFAVAHIITG